MHTKDIDSKMHSLDSSDLKTIELYSVLDVDFTAEELLDMCLPFGNIMSIQVNERRGLPHGLVTFSGAGEAELAMRRVNDEDDFYAQLVEPVKDRGIDHFRRSKGPRRLESAIVYKAPRRFPNASHPPENSRGVCLRIDKLPRRWDQRRYILSSLPTNAINVKVERKKGAEFTVPDLRTALWIKEFLQQVDLGPTTKPLMVYFYFKGDVEYPEARAPQDNETEEIPLGNDCPLQQQA